MLVKIWEYRCDLRSACLIVSKCKPPYAVEHVGSCTGDAEQLDEHVPADAKRRSLGKLDCLIPVQYLPSVYAVIQARVPLGKSPLIHLQIIVKVFWITGC